MDPIFYQVNQTRLTEVTQKSSDNLRLQGNKEGRRKAEKAGDVDKAAMSTDSSSMSDDMLGNMDPDDYGGRGAKQFAQMWKEQMQEEEERKQSQDQSEQEGEDSSQEQEQEPAPEPQDETAANPIESEIEALPEDNTQTAALGSDQYPATNTTTHNPEEAETTRTQAEAEAQKPAAEVIGSDQAQISPPVSSQPETLTKGEKATTPSAEVVQLTQTRQSAAFSLLDFSSGFLIAEEARFDTEAKIGSDPEAVPESEEALPEEISILLERLISGDSSQPGFRKLQQLLSRFGRRVLQLCIETQAKVYLLPPGEPLLAHPLLATYGEMDLQDAVYIPQQRLCLIEDKCLTQVPDGFHPVFYYFAHLWDHALGGENFASCKSAAVKASFQMCLEGGHRFGDLMSSYSPVHYFAQAVESYLSENDCFEPLWTRQDLYDFDRSIYDYIEYLLR